MTKSISRSPASSPIGKPLLRALCATSLAIACFSASADWVLIRGVNFDPRTPGATPAINIGNGNAPSVGVDELLTNLSVNCAENPKDATIQAMIRQVPNQYYYRVDLSQLKGALIAQDRVATNEYHCLLSDVTPKAFISKAVWKKK